MGSRQYIIPTKIILAHYQIEMLAPESEVYAADEAEDNISPTEKGEFSKPS